MVLYIVYSNREEEEMLAVRGEERRGEWRRGERGEISPRASSKTLAGGAVVLGIFAFETVEAWMCRCRCSMLHVPGCTVCEYWGGTAEWCKAKLRSDASKSEMMVMAMLLRENGE